MSNIEIRGIDRTPLDEAAYMKVIRRYWRMDRKLQVRFRKVQGNLGEHKWDEKGQRHVISISPERTRIETKVASYSMKSGRCSGTAVKLRESDWIANMISTTLHEIRHAHQLRKNPERYYYDRDYDLHPKCSSTVMASWFSPCETDARAYEFKNAAKAIDLYWKHVNAG